MEAKDLSKVKYIYRIYESSDGLLHFEKYPVIYVNSKVVYFKTGRKQEMLSYKYVKDIIDNFYEFQDGVGWYRNYYDQCFWKVEDNIEEIYRELKRQRFLLRQGDDAKKKQLRLERAKREYEAALKEVELFEKMKEVLGNKE